MLKVKTSELEGAALDWAVAKCDNKLDKIVYWKKCRAYYYPGAATKYSPSTKWAQGGPLIEREKITLVPMPQGTWSANKVGLAVLFHQRSPLIAAMRVYVASVLGDEIEVPEDIESVASRPVEISSIKP